MCWLHSMQNLLIIQQLKTLYLGGNYVRVVCEGVWKFDQVYAIKEHLKIGSHDWLVSGDSPEVSHVWSMHEVKGSWQLDHYRTKSTVWLLCWRLEIVTHPSRESLTKALYFVEKWLFTFLLIPYYKYPYIHEM